MNLRNQSSLGAALAVAMALFGMTGSLLASSTPTSQPAPKQNARSHARQGMVHDAVASANASVTSLSQEFTLRLKNLHTGESLDVVYRVGDTYIPEALAQLNYFLRDHNTQDVIHYDPKEFDVLHSVLERLRRPNGVIDVVCGYRTPETNEALRRESAHSGVAEHSQHMEGKAIDIRVPGVSTVRLRNAALSLHEGGVGYYPVSHFVHVDVGPVREWSFGRSPRRAYRHRNRVRVGE
jgi:uncharacterized protein YcbK (DUF882 family)